MDFEEHVIDRKPIYDGAVINVENQTVKLPNGQVSHRDVVHHANAVGILVITSDNKIVLEKQWRAPIAKTTIEIPAGKLDDRDNSYEDAVIRELNEEIRVIPKKVQEITGFYTTAGFSDEYMKLYLATDLTSVNQELPRDAGEFLEIQEKTLPEALDMIKSGEVDDAKTIMAIWYWQLTQR